MVVYFKPYFFEVRKCVKKPIYHSSGGIRSEVTPPPKIMIYEMQAFHHDVTVPRICPGSDQIFAKYQGLDPGHDLLTTPR